MTPQECHTVAKVLLDAKCNRKLSYNTCMRCIGTVIVTQIKVIPFPRRLSCNNWQWISSKLIAIEYICVKIRCNVSRLSLKTHG